MNSSVSFDQNRSGRELIHSVSSEQIIECMRNTITEIQEQSRECTRLRLLNTEYSYCKSKESLYIHETLDSEERDSFCGKQTDLLSEINTLRNNVKLMRNKLELSELRVKNVSDDRELIEELIQDLKDKVEKRKNASVTNDNYSCSNCLII